MTLDTPSEEETISRIISHTTGIVVLAFLTATATELAVQGFLPSTAETFMRRAATILAIVSIPVLLVLASKSRISADRLALPTWRGAMGTASILMIAMVWVLSLVAEITAWTFAARWFSLDLFTALLICNVAGFVCAFGPRGAPRAQQVAAALFVWSWLQASIYR